MIGRSQAMNRCRPPSAAIRSAPGDSMRWNVFPRTMQNPSPATSTAVSDRTLPRVASGMNAGVSTTPDGVWSRPVRAAPSRSTISKRRRSGSDLTGPEAYASASRLLLLRGAVDGAGADLDPVGLALLGLRDADLEDPLVEVGADLLGVDLLRQRHRSREAAERALDTVEAVRPLLVLGLALPGDGENAVLDLD